MIIWYIFFQKHLVNLMQSNLKSIDYFLFHAIINTHHKSSTQNLAEIYTQLGVLLKVQVDSFYTCYTSPYHAPKYIIGNISWGYWVFGIFSATLVVNLMVLRFG